MEYPILIHSESGRKILIEDEKTVSLWVPWRNAWVPVDSLLLKKYKPPCLELVDSTGSNPVVHKNVRVRVPAEVLMYNLKFQPRGRRYVGGSVGWVYN